VVIRSPPPTPGRDEKRAVGHGHGHGFFGSIRGLFKGGHHHQHQKEREESDSDGDAGNGNVNERQRLGSLFGREGDKDRKWAMRGDRKLKVTKRGKRVGVGVDSDSDDEVVRDGSAGKAAKGERGGQGHQKLRKSKGKRDRAEAETEDETERAQRMAAKRMGEQNISWWMTDGHSGGAGAQGQGHSGGKSKGTMKKGKSKTRGENVQDGTLFSSSGNNNNNDGPFYLAPASRRNSTLSDSHLPMAWAVVDCHAIIR